MKDGVYQGTCSGSWVGHAEVYKDFVLECELYHDSVGGGAIVLRDNRDIRKTWESGYSMGFFPTEDGKRIKMGFSVYPEDMKDKMLYFPPRTWQKIRMEMRGNTITVTLNGKDRITVTDPTHRFEQGQICLEDHPCKEGVPCTGEGHVKYRNVCITPVSTAQ